MVWYVDDRPSDGIDNRPLYSILETIHTAFIGAYLYISSVSHFGDLEKFQIAHWTLGFSIPVANLVMALVQVRLFGDYFWIALMIFSGILRLQNILFVWSMATHDHLVDWFFPKMGFLACHCDYFAPGKVS